MLSRRRSPHPAEDPRPARARGTPPSSAAGDSSAAVCVLFRRRPSAAAVPAAAAYAPAFRPPAGPRSGRRSCSRSPYGSPPYAASSTPAGCSGTHPGSPAATTRPTSTPAGRRPRPRPARAAVRIGRLARRPGWRCCDVSLLNRPRLVTPVPFRVRGFDPQGPLRGDDPTSVRQISLSCFHPWFVRTRVAVLSVSPLIVLRSSRNRNCEERRVATPLVTPHSDWVFASQSSGSSISRLELTRTIVTPPNADGCVFRGTTENWRHDAGSLDRRTCGTLRG